MDTRTLELPRLVAGRDYADDLVASFASAGDPADQDVVVDGTHLLSGTSSFAAELVRRLLIDGKAKSMLLVGAPAEFAGYVTAAARELQVTDRFDLAEHLPAAS